MEEDYLYSQKIDHQVLNGIADPIRVLDSDERVIFVNEAMEKTLGYDRKNLLCDIDESIFNPDITRSVLRTGEVVQREEIIKSISSELPFIIRNFTGIQRLSRKLGFKDIDLKDSYFPKLTFRYRSHQGRVNKAYDFIFNIENLNDLIEYLSKKIKFKKSVAGQRALMTPKLRDEIKARDNNTCQICGLSTKDEPNLLLEIDHIIPLSKGGMTTEDNLQTLCWKCNRSKGSKIYKHI